MSVYMHFMLSNRTNEILEKLFFSDHPGTKVFTPEVHSHVQETFFYYMQSPHFAAFSFGRFLEGNNVLEAKATGAQKSLHGER